MLKLGKDWKEVLRYAWSIKGMAIVAVCMLLDVVFSTLGAFAGNFLFAIVFKLIGLAAALGSIVARLLVQKELP